MRTQLLIMLGGTLLIVVGLLLSKFLRALVRGTLQKPAHHCTVHVAKGEVTVSQHLAEPEGEVRR